MSNLPIDDKFKQEAYEALKFMRRGLFEYIYGMRIINEKKYFTAYGFDSFEDFCKVELDIEKRMMQRYLRIGTYFLPAILENESNSKDSTSHVTQIWQLGVVKLDILIGLGAQKISELLISGSLIINNKKYFASDFKQMDRDKLRDLIRGADQQQTDDQPKSDNDENIPFDKVYNNVKKYFDKVSDNIQSCPEILEIDQRKMMNHLMEVGYILDKYQSMDKRK